MSMLQLCMQRKNLKNLPQLNVPTGYTERGYREGDAWAWCDIIAQSFEDEKNVDGFVSDMLEHEAYLPERIRFVCDQGGVPCATASAYRNSVYGNENGYVHMVGILPSHAGKKLGYAVSLAVLQQFAKENCPSAYLQTDDFRIAAIKTYLRLDFTPKIVDDSQYKRWQSIYTQLEIDPPDSIKNGCS